MKTLWLYAAMSRVDRLNYRSKIMIMAFIGTHIPLMGLIGYFSLKSAPDWQTFMASVGVTLMATLIGTGVTLFVLNHLLRPVTMTAATLRKYRTDRDTGSLPTHFKDEVGALMADATHTLVDLEKVLDRLENLDRGTGLANRKKLVAEVDRRIGKGRAFSACAIRFSDYTRILETIDLHAAELAMIEMATRLAASLDEGETLYRASGSDFVFMTATPDGNETAGGALRTRLSTLLSACARPLDLQSITLEPVLFGGISSYPQDARTGETMIDQALSASARATETAPIGFHSLTARRAAIDQFQLEQDLRKALARDEFLLHYQPVIDLSLGRTVGAEALIRWQHPERGLVPPLKFIGAAEASGLIDPIGLWVMRNACRQIRDWNKDGPDGLKIAINLSARQFLDPDLIGHVRQSLDAYGISPNQLEIELTETAAMADHVFTRSVFGRLRDLGVSIAIDDFGTGYAGMSYLRKLPFDKLKIDREFVTNVHKTRDSQAICGALVTLAKGMDLTVLAEGTETEEEVRYLQSQGCTLFQGYHFSRPLSAPDFQETVSEVSLRAMAMADRHPPERRLAS